MTLEELQIKFTADTAGLRTQLQGVERQIGSLEKSASKAQDFLKGFAKGAVITGVALVGRKMVQVGKDALAMANDVVESEQLFEVSMGRMADKARSWSDKISDELGLNPYEMRKNVGMLNTMFGSMGLGEQEAYDMATSLTELANDMASFYNLDTEEAFTKLRAGITGETEPLKRLGILVDEQTVAQYALKSGISKTGKELTQQQKLQARYGAIMEQTAKAQGDLARTMDSPTNQLRRLNAEFDMAKIALGQALQPALIAVLPHVTNFASGLTRMLKGGSGGDPLSGTINDLAGATAAIKSRVDMSIVDIVAEIARLQEGTETAVDGYIQAASETRDLYISINLKPQSNVLERMTKYLRGLNNYVDSVTAKTIEEDITIMMNAALEDGEVTEDEVNAIREELRKKIQAILDKKQTEYDAAIADIRIRLAKGQIDESQAKAEVDALNEAHNKNVAGIKALEVSMSAELGITSWTASTISADDRQRMTDAINKEIAAGEALLVSANAQVQALFEGSSLEQAVLGMYGDLTTQINTNNAEINKLLTAWLDEDDGAAFEKAMAKREENKKLLAIATGGLTAEGKINKALLAIGDATPEELTNFAKGYKDIFGSMIEGYIERGTERENVLLNMPDSYFAEQGTTRRQMIDENTAETNAAIAQANAMLLKSVTDALGPQISKILNDPNVGYAETLNMAIAIDGLRRRIDIKGLDAAGTEQYNTLKKMLSDLDTLMEKRLSDYDPMAYENKGYKAPPKLTQYYNPMAYENKGYKDLVFSGADITISNPRMKYQSLPDGYGGRGGKFGGTSNVNVEVAPQDIVVNMYLDETQLGRATIRATQTVTRSTGGGGSGPGGPTVLVNE